MREGIGLGKRLNDIIRDMLSVIVGVVQQLQDLLEAKKPNDVFSQENQKRLRTVEFGSSFSPEHIEELYVENKKGRKPTPRELLEMLQIVVEEFSIKDIRLGIRWNKVAKANGTIDLSYYKPFLSYCMSKSCRITFNIGPIKTFRWPEQYVPEFVLQQLECMPQKGTILSEEDKILTNALQYLKKLLKALRQEFSQEQLQYIKVIQPENESLHAFGIYKWRMSEEYLERVVAIVLKEFPDVSIMLNSSETTNLNQIQKFFSTLTKKYPKLKGRLILGFNYYYRVPGRITIPFIHTIDSITLNKQKCKENIRCCEDMGFQIEISEAQCEPWPPIWSPGNSVEEFRFMIMRCIKNILPADQYSVIRLWGIERLAKARLEAKLNDDQEKIIELIKAINSSFDRR